MIISYVAISVGGHSMFQCCDKIKLGIVASSKQSKIRTTPRYSKSGNLFDNNEYNLQERFPDGYQNSWVNDTIALNAFEKAEKLHGNIFNSKNCFSFLYGTIHREMANKYGIHQKLYVHLSDWETHTSKQ